MGVANCAPTPRSQVLLSRAAAEVEKQKSQLAAEREFLRTELDKSRALAKSLQDKLRGCGHDETTVPRLRNPHHTRTLQRVPRPMARLSLGGVPW